MKKLQLKLFLTTIGLYITLVSFGIFVGTQVGKRPNSEIILLSSLMGTCLIFGTNVVLWWLVYEKNGERRPLG